MLRVVACVIFTIFFPALAAGQSPKCGFDEASRLVSCDRESRSVFQFEIAYLDIGVLSQLQNAPEQKGGGRERCRTFAEDFRSQLDKKFNVSLDGLRTQAEKVRSASEDNLSLYKQIMLVYDSLLIHYSKCLQAYQDTLRACHVVPPYDTRPPRTQT